MATAPLQGLRVLDFSTLLPGPLCSLLLADAGAVVIKVERPGSGDEMRSYEPKLGEDSVNFVLLNRGKRSVTIDLKSAQGRAQALRLIADADVLIEQFRPGVMARLGLGYDDLLTLNPRLIYCSITGYGQTGPLAHTAAHDLNYLAETGMLALTAGADGSPVLPQALVADIAGGAYPAMMNILLALMQRDRTGRGLHIDVSMADNLFPLMYWALGNGLAEGEWCRPGGALVTGASPRYNIYRTADQRYLAVAALEQKFWQTFLQLIGASPHLDDSVDPIAAAHEVAELIAGQTAAHWERLFAGQDVCVSAVKSLRDAVAHPHFIERGLLSRTVVQGERCLSALPTPISPSFRAGGDETHACPSLGEGNEELLAPVLPDRAYA